MQLDAPTINDQDLVARAQAGDPDAVDDLIRAARRTALRYARARLSTYSGGAEASEDVAQEICLALVNALPGYESSAAPFGAFVYAIAAHKVADAQRRYGRARWVVVDTVPDDGDPAPGPEQQAMDRAADADARTLLEHTLTLLDQLPPLMAEVVRLRATGLPAEEVGQVVGATANSVRVTHHRGLTRLRRLAAETDDPVLISHRTLLEETQ